MPLQITPPAGETIAQIRAAIEAAISGARVEVGGEGGRFKIQVVSEVFSGKNTLAIHCRQTTGGQYIDVHLVDAK